MPGALASAATVAADAVVARKIQENPRKIQENPRKSREAKKIENKSMTFSKNLGKSMKIKGKYENPGKSTENLPIFTFLAQPLFTFLAPPSSSQFSPKSEKVSLFKNPCKKHGLGAFFEKCKSFTF